MSLLGNRWRCESVDELETQVAFGETPEYLQNKVRNTTKAKRHALKRSFHFWRPIFRPSLSKLCEAFTMYNFFYQMIVTRLEKKFLESRKDCFSKLST